jgi:outer membrane receptor protein involved in Fe transport
VGSRRPFGSRSKGAAAAAGTLGRNFMTDAVAGRAGFARNALLSGVGLAAMVVPATAWAQDDAAKQPGQTVAQAQAAAEAAAANAPANNQNASAGNSIVVTATKREQTLQDVPVAVTVTTADTIERAQIRDLNDLQAVVPSLQVGQRQSVANTNFFIRGFGNGANNVGIEPSVGVFVDNVYRSRTDSQISDLPDVQRIEVLRGPQSTLFGKNASAGVISITTRKPSFVLAGEGELTYGNYNTFIGKGYITGPITNDIAVSLAGGFNERDGFFRDRGTGHRENERDRWFVRGQMLYDPGTNITVRLIGDFDRIAENCCAVVNLQSSSATLALMALGGHVNPPADKFKDYVYYNHDSTNDIRNWGGSGQVDWDLGPAKLTYIGAYRRTRAITNQDPDFTSADLIYPNYQDLKLRSITQEVRLTGKLADRVNWLAGAFYINENIHQDNTLHYASQFRPYANLLIQGATGGEIDVPTLEATFGALEGNPAKYLGRFFANGQGFSEQYLLRSEAISLFGQTDTELAKGLTLTLGGNWTDDRKNLFTNVSSSDVFSNINLDAPQYAPFRQALLYQGALAVGVGTALGLNGPASAQQIQGLALANPAAFAFISGQSTAYANANANNPAANPLAPLRTLQFLPPFQNVPNAVESGRTHDHKFSYTIRLAYDFDSRFNIYASYATGFKASSVNLSRDSRPSRVDWLALEQRNLAVNNLTFGSRFAGPENARVIEGGIKANLGWLSANLAVFDESIKGFQSNLFTGVGFALLNAGKESTRGVEFESVATLHGLTLNFGATYLDPKYDSFNNSSVGNLTGTKPAGIPKWTVLLGAEYSAPVGNGHLVPRVSYLYQSDTQLVEGLPGFLVRGPDGSILDASGAIAAAKPFRREVNDVTASLGYEMDNGISVEVWSHNLLNSRNILTIFDSVAQPRGVSGYPNDPRTYGITARYKW